MADKNVKHTNEKVASVSYVETLFHKLYEWMPFVRKNGGIMQNSKDENGVQQLETTNPGEIALGKYNETDINTLLSIGIGTREFKKNALKVTNDGEIFIITDIVNYKTESLQQILEKKGVTFLSDESELNEFITADNVGRMFYVTSDNGGLYVISYKTPSGYDAFKIGGSMEADLSNYYTKEEVNVLIDAITAGDIDLTNYYTISQVDEKIKEVQDQIDNIDERLTFVEDVIETPITTEDLETIIGLDMNNDGKIGK